ncbi:MAG: hypothetical protein ACYC8T_38270 [Myxococcaceae bacterium]
MSRSLVLGFAGLLAAGCVRHHQRFGPNDVVGEGEVVLLGRALIDPPMTFPDEYPVGDMLTRESPVTVLFTFEAGTKLEVENLTHGADRVASVGEDTFFVADLVFEPHYLKGIRAYRGFEEDGRDMITFVMLCEGTKKIDLKPGDKYVYIGTFVCVHDEERPLGIRVYDEYEKLLPHWKKLIGDHVPTRRIARDLDLAPPLPGKATPAAAPQKAR